MCRVQYTCANSHAPSNLHLPLIKRGVNKVEAARLLISDAILYICLSGVHSVNRHRRLAQETVETRTGGPGPATAPTRVADEDIGLFLTASAAFRVFGAVPGLGLAATFSV